MLNLCAWSTCVAGEKSSTVSEFQIQLILFPAYFLGGNYHFCTECENTEFYHYSGIFLVGWWFDIEEASGSLVPFYSVLQELTVTFVTGSGELLDKVIFYWIESFS